MPEECRKALEAKRGTVEPNRAGSAKEKKMEDEFEYQGSRGFSGCDMITISVCRLTIR